MKLNYKKQKLVESLGFNVNFKNHYGNKPQNVKVTPDQFKRLMESYLVYEEEMHKEEEDLELAEFADSFQDELDQDILDEMDMEKETKEGYGKKPMDEMNFGDDGGLNLPSDVDMDTENDNNPIDLDEYGYQSIDHSDRDEFDGRKSRVVGVYSDINKQRYGMNEDSEGMETYHYDEDLHHDRDELHHLERERDHSHGGHAEDLLHHIAALIDSMKYDDKRGVGHDDKYRREPGTHFYHEGNGLAESVDKTFRMIREAIRKERPRGLRMSNYSRKTLNEQFVGYSEMEEQFYGGRGNYNNPGVNAAKGVEELVKNIKRAYNFIKDSKTKKQIHNTLVKLQNFMAITADAVMAGKQQRAPRRNDQLTRPLPYPELDEPEDLEDIDDELDLDSLNESQRHNVLREAKRELKRRTLQERQMSPPLINPTEEAERLADAFNSNKIKIKYNNDNKVFNVKRAYRSNGPEVTVFTDNSQPWLFDGDNPDISISGDEYGEFKPVSINAYDNSDGKQVALDAVYEREGLTNKNKFTNQITNGYLTGTGIPIDIRFVNSEMDGDYDSPYYYSFGGRG